MDDADVTGTLRSSRQCEVFEWVEKAFGKEHARSLPQRATRFFEEAIELFQAAGGDLAMAHKLLDFVFARPIGELSKEIGAVGLTLLSVAHIANVNADREEWREVRRVTSQDPEIFAKRNREKNEAGFDAMAYPTEIKADRIDLIDAKQIWPAEGKANV